MRYFLLQEAEGLGEVSAVNGISSSVAFVAT